MTRRAFRWLIVVIFAAAMAWVEAAVVFYLRTLVHRIEPYQPMPLPVESGLGRAEIVREAATLVMLLMVGVLAGRTWRARLGFTAVAFGVWDIFYYVFLKVLCGWPHSIQDWDVLFLLPLPWWGPVIAPVLISVLMILWGTWAGCREREHLGSPADWKVWLANFAGVLLALYVFMADNLRAVNQGADAWRKVLPRHFQWPLFWAALTLMAVPVLRVVWDLKKEFMARVMLSQSEPGRRPKHPIAQGLQIEQ